MGVLLPFPALIKQYLLINLLIYENLFLIRFRRNNWERDEVYVRMFVHGLADGEDKGREEGELWDLFFY